MTATPPSPQPHIQLITRQTSPRYLDGNNPSALRPVVGVIWEQVYSGSGFQNEGAGNATANGGFFYLLGNVGVEANGTNLEIVDINDDALFPGTHKAFRNTYYASGAGNAFANHVMFIQFPLRPKFYLRSRLRFSSAWEYGSNQLKFCKTHGHDEPRVSFNHYFNGSGEWVVTADNGVGQSTVFANWNDTPTPYLYSDDINNNFGGPGIDENWVPTNGQWHTIEMESDVVAPNSNQGRHRMWVDGELYIDKAGLILSTDPLDDMIGRLEFGGHVWEDGTPSTDIYIDIRDTAVYAERPGPPPGF